MTTLLHAGENTGASSAWTSDDPVTGKAVALFHAGEFSAAEQLLANSNGHVDRAEMAEIIRRTRRDYDQTLDSLLARLRESIPDVTAGDIERWRDAGQVQHRIIDGQVAYFRREPANIFRFCAEAKQRREAHAKIKPAPEQKPAFVLEDHLRAVIEAAERSGQREVLPVRHRVKFSATVPAGAAGSKPGALLRCWLPFPQEYRQQRDVRLIRASREDAMVAPNVVDAMPMGGAPQRTVYFEQPTRGTGYQPVSSEDQRGQVAHATDDGITFEIEFEYSASAYYPILNDNETQPLPSDFPRQYLDERLPHIAFTPQIRRKVAELVGDETNPLAKARKIFHFIDREIAYCAEEEYATIPSFATKAFTARRGDCGVQTMLFITMCRIAGVPARWQSGWQSKPGQINMHDWAEFYVEPWGWLPADPSYGLQKSDDPKMREFYFGHQDSYRMIVNLDYGSPLHPPKPSLRSEPADFQRGEIELDGRNLYYDEWIYDVKFVTKH